MDDKASFTQTAHNCGVTCKPRRYLLPFLRCIVTDTQFYLYENVQNYAEIIKRNHTKFSSPGLNPWLCHRSI